VIYSVFNIYQGKWNKIGNLFEKTLSDSDESWCKVEEEESEGAPKTDEMTEMDKTRENGVQWTLGDEVREQDDIFPQNGDTTDSSPPAAPSDGQGGLTPVEQKALIEKRKRLK
jgi:hypothetical protein